MLRILGFGTGIERKIGEERFLGRVVRISVGGVKKHKWNESATIADAQDPPAEVFLTIPPTLSVPCEVEIEIQPPVVDELLPLIELRHLDRQHPRTLAVSSGFPAHFPENTHSPH